LDALGNYSIKSNVVFKRAQKQGWLEELSKLKWRKADEATSYTVTDML
jgi:hypothetical protein